MSQTTSEYILEDVRVLAEDLVFPEGPVVLAGGDLLVTEVRAGRVTRITPDGRKSIVAETGHRPNGIAIGPDGAAYVCNNGGPERFKERSASIQRIDLESGAVDVLYKACDDRDLIAPNDIVFDRTGNFWFTDYGTHLPGQFLYGAIHYARPDGTRIERAIADVMSPNGIGLSPDERTLYYAETISSRVVRREIVSPGTLSPSNGLDPVAMAQQGGADLQSLLVGLAGFQPFDSLAVDSEGYVVVATLSVGCLTAISPDGSIIERHFLPPGVEDHLVTNVCFGGPDMRTAYVTLSGTGRLVSCRWPRAGLPLLHQS